MIKWKKIQMEKKVRNEIITARWSFQKLLLNNSLLKTFNEEWLKSVIGHIQLSSSCVKVTLVGKEEEFESILV